MSTKHTPGFCYNCGADDGLHHYYTTQCPVGGVEETRDGRKQQWADTTFENTEWRKVRDAAPELLEALKDCLERLEIDYPGGFNERIIKAKAAIKKATE